MNNRTIRTFLFLLLCQVGSIYGDFSGSVEVRVAAFFPDSSRYREIYDDIGVSYQLEASTKLTNCLGRWGCCLDRRIEALDVWANVDWIPQHGHSIGCCNSTRVNIGNLSFGIKFPFQICECLTGYLGLGPSFGGVWLKNHAQCKHHNVSKFAPGVVVKAGINYAISNNYYLDLFVDYIYQEVHFESHVDVGGVKTGVGIGMLF